MHSAKMDMKTYTDAFMKTIASPYDLRRTSARCAWSRLKMMARTI